RRSKPCWGCDPAGTGKRRIGGDIPRITLLTAPGRRHTLSTAIRRRLREGSAHEHNAKPISRTASGGDGWEKLRQRDGCDPVEVTTTESMEAPCPATTANRKRTPASGRC